MTAALQLYSFVISDEDAASPTFGCVADSADAARARVRAAGYEAFVLLDIRDLAPHEHSAAAAARINANPLLGPSWIPLVDAISIATARLRVRRSWILNTYSRLHDFDPYRSPYVQAMLEPDGSLHLEVSHTVSLSSRTSEQFYEELELLGWSSPTLDSSAGNTGSDEELAISGIPNAHRLFEPGWNARGVAEFFIATLSLVHGITNEDFFSFGDELSDEIDAQTSLVRLDRGPIFHLPIKLMPADSEQHDDEPDAEDVVSSSTYFDAQAIYDVLNQAGILESQGAAMNPTPLQAQGVCYEMSSFSDDQVEAYLIDIEVSTDSGHDEIRSAARRSFDEDPTILVCVAGENWSVELRPGLPDGEIPRDIAEQIMESLGGILIGEREIPEPSWFESEHASASDLLAAISSTGFIVSASDHAEIHKWDSAAPYVAESLESDDFCFAVFLHRTRSGRDAQLRLHLFTEENWASAVLELLSENYFPIDLPHTIVIADGWAVRLVADELGLATGADLHDAAHGLNAVLGGQIVDAAGKHLERTTDAPAAPTQSDAVPNEFKYVDSLHKPYIPDDIAPQLVEFDEHNFATSQNPLSPIGLYQFGEQLEKAVFSDRTSSIQFGFAGHGMASYAHSYLLVDGGIAVAGQLGRGGLIFDPMTESARGEWSALTAGATAFHALSRSYPAPTNDQLFVVYYSSLRELAGWGVVDRSSTDHQFLPPQGMDSLSERDHRFGQDGLERLFAAASQAYLEHVLGQLNAGL